LDAGKSVLIKLSAVWEGDELKLRALWVKDLDAEAAGAGEGLRLHVNDAAALPGIAAQLKTPGKGVITLVVPGGAGEEVEIALPRRHQVTTTLKDALRIIPGVMEVESV
jgi:DNA polymerase-3 subunit alpha